jgi:drug/metabolite transporter (DMT)-like permease
MTLQALPTIGLLGLVYGTTLIASRFGVGQFAPTTFIGLRLMLAGLGHAAVYLLGRRPLPRSRGLWRHATVLGTLGTAVPMIGIVGSLQFQSSGVTALLLTTGPAFTVLLAHFFLPDERLTRRAGMGVALALSGAALLALRGESGLADVRRASSLGYGMVLGAMIVVSMTLIYTRRYMRDLDRFDVGSVRMWTAAAVVMPLSALLVGVDVAGVDGRGVAALLFGGLVGSFAGMQLEFAAVQRFGATATAMTSYVIPIVAGVGGVLVLSEQFTLFMLLGMGLIVGGIALIQRR